MNLNHALQFFPPNPAMRSVVHHFQWMRYDTKIHAQKIDMLPSFGLGLIFYFWKGQPLVANSPIIQQQTVPRVVVQGASTHPTQGSNFDDFDMVRVLFRPGQMHKVFSSIPMDAFCNEVPDATVALDRGLQDLYEQMQAEPLVTQKINLLDAWIYQRLQKNKIERAIFPQFSHLLEQPHRRPKTVQQIADHLGISRQHFSRLTKQQLGYSAKQALSIYQFNQIIPYFHQQTAISLSETAHRFGYADQAHFTRTFKRYVGTNPAAYLKAKGKVEIYGKSDDFLNSGMIFS
ncbi:MAG: AraC family transcriptional regulator [Bacteroidota bacterium]